MKKQILKYSVLITLFFFFGSFAFSSTVYFSPKVGLKNGIVREYVFDNNHKLSQLDWNVQNQIDFGFETDFFVENLYFGFDFSVGLYNFSGFMEDRDWFYSSKPDELTRFSSHDLIVTQNLDFSFDFGIILSLKGDKSKRQLSKNHGLENYISAFFQFNFYSYNFEGVKGWYDYKDKNETGTFEDYGKVISYNPNFTSLMLGVEGNFNFWDNFSIKTVIATSFLTKGICIDNHWLSKTEFIDSIEGNLFLKGILELSYNFNRKNALVFGGKVEKLPILKGVSYQNGMLSGAIGGADSFFYEFYLSYRIRML